MQTAKRALVILSVAWLLSSLAFGAWLFFGWERDFSQASPAIAGASEPVDEEHARLIYRYFPEKLSQHWEEMLIRDYFNDRRGGTFVDVGANHYRTRSTTHYLDVALGWRGIAVDPITELAADYEEHRPGTIYVAAYAGERSDEDVEFFVVSRNTRLSTGVEDLARRLEEDGEVESRVVKTASLTDILDAHGFQSLDLLKMDIELAEPAALRGFDIDRFRPKLILIEYHEEVRDEIDA
ncbi:MAG TPA: FkbM family methyltransferase, partial [Longimicrobiales bacterium]|nr:FkbM family methyltransferase [Longimicrobiales bacterium]